MHSRPIILANRFGVFCLTKERRNLAVVSCDQWTTMALEDRASRLFPPFRSRTIVHRNSANFTLRTSVYHACAGDSLFRRQPVHIGRHFSDSCCRRVPVTRGTIRLRKVDCAAITGRSFATHQRQCHTIDCCDWRTEQYWICLSASHVTSVANSRSQPAVADGTGIRQQQSATHI